MDAAVIVLIIAATITATRSRRHARWPLAAAATLAILPFAVVFVTERASGSSSIGATNGALVSFVSWPVAWALLIGWFFRVSRRPLLVPRTKAKRP